jgi:hypothetical protein
MIENTWVFPAVEALHLIGMALFLGPVLLGDLGLLGAVRRTAVLRPSPAALALVLLTGMALLAANPARYARNPAFVVKLGLLLLAFAAHARLHRRGRRAAAAFSLALWSLVILASRAVIDFDV